jgi:tripartite-type tricarboxylate transporter receptor subunit TctC
VRCRGAFAQTAAQPTYPQRPVKLVVPFAPGGSTDIVARLVAEAMHAPLGQSVVVENKAGAGGMVGAEAVARAAPDGYTVGLGSISTLAVNPVVLPQVRVDPLKDLAPVLPLARLRRCSRSGPNWGSRTSAALCAWPRPRATVGRWAHRAWARWDI